MARKTAEEPERLLTVAVETEEALKVSEELLKTAEEAERLL